MKFKDGTIISYDRSSHTLKAQIGDTQIVADQKNVQVSAPSLVSLKSGENTEVNSGKETNIGASSEVNITAPTLTLSMGATKMVLSSGNASIETDHLTFKGNVTVSGNLSVKGDIDGTGNISCRRQSIRHQYLGEIMSFGVTGLFGLVPFVCSASVVSTFKDVNRELSTRWAQHDVIGQKSDF